LERARYTILGIKSYFYKDKIIVVGYYYNGKGRYPEDRLLERLRRYYVYPSISRSCRILLNIGKRLCNKGRANLPTTTSKRSICIGHGIDSRYKDSKVYNHYRTYISLAGL
jgi:hypothetical protein